MPRVQVYLPDDLYAELKARKLKASKLFQQAVREELHREHLRDEAGKFIEELEAEVGEPSPEAVAWAEDLTDRILAHTTKDTPPKRRAG
jgi:hypothetical protein